MKKLILSAVLTIIMATGTGIAYAEKYLVYDPGGQQDNIQSAMNSLGFTFDVRNASTGVTLVDLSSGYEALVIGWSYGGNYSGLNGNVLGEGITGNKILTGHDADYHTAAGIQAAEVFMDRAVRYAGAATGTGILAFPAWALDPFPYLSASWGIAAVGQFSGEIITEVTAFGTASGLYAGLTLANLSNWGQSFHAKFTQYGGLDVFENSFQEAITIGTTVTPLDTQPVPEPGTFFLLGSGLAGLAFWRRKKTV